MSLSGRVIDESERMKKEVVHGLLECTIPELTLKN
jgi:hypothetical protein